MKILDPGHLYEVDVFFKSKSNIHCEKEQQTVRFLKDDTYNGGTPYPGTTCQELIRVLINRVEFLDNQNSHEYNNQIVDNLREALLLFEKRHLDRLLEKGLKIEDLPTDSDGHFILKRSGKDIEG